MPLPGHGGGAQTVEAVVLPFKTHIDGTPSVVEFAFYCSMCG